MYSEQQQRDFEATDKALSQLSVLCGYTSECLR